VTVHGQVLIWSGEDSIKATLLPRLIASGADRNNVHFVDNVFEDGKKVTFDPSKHMDGLIAEANKLSNLKLVIIEPVVRSIRRGSDSHRTADVSRDLQTLVDFATERKVAVLGIMHLTKDTVGKDPLERLSGSGAFGGTPRLVFGAVAPGRSGLG
jgi:putative DNA primase/helicase